MKFGIICKTDERVELLLIWLRLQRRMGWGKDL